MSCNDAFGGFKGFDRESLNLCFSELAKELKKHFGRKAKIEIVIVGGASVLLNYDFRESTIDVDAMVSSQNSIKDAVNAVGDRFGLPNGWVNSDFRQTKSYSPNIIRHSKLYRTYNQSLTVRTVSGEYLVAMKLASLRKYTRDKSDIVGIIREESKTQPISYDKIDRAGREFYGGWENMDPDAKPLVRSILESSKKEDLYQKLLEEEENIKQKLADFDRNYEGVLQQDNLEDIISRLQESDGARDNMRDEGRIRTRKRNPRKRSKSR